jgi:hypothetical protein
VGWGAQVVNSIELLDDGVVGGLRRTAVEGIDVDIGTGQSFWEAWNWL